MNESQKTLLRRAEIIQNEKHLQFSNGMILVLFSLGELVFSAIWTIIIAFNASEIPPIFWVLIILISLLFWGTGAILAFLAIQANLSLLYLLTGKYTLEIDRIARMELRSEKNYRHSRSLIGKLSKPDYITYQYVDFAKFGTYKTDTKQSFAKDQEFYVLVVPTKTPTILHLWPCDEYELVDR